MAIDNTTRNEKGQFLPGIAPNPMGRPKATGEIREGRKMLAHLFEFYGQKLSQSTVTQIQKIIVDNETTAWEGIIAACYAKALEGSMSHCELLFNRLIGKPPEKFFISGEEGADPTKLRMMAMSIVELREFIREKYDELKEIEGTPE